MIALPHRIIFIAVLLSCIGSGLAKEKPQAAAGKTGTISLLGGKLTLELPADFVPEKQLEAKQSIAEFKARKGTAWGSVTRGTGGVTPERLPTWMEAKYMEYDKSLPAELNLRWLRRELVTIRGRQWADLRFVPTPKGGKDYQKSPLYTRFLATSFEGQLLEIHFTTNLETDPALKAKIDRTMDSVRLAP